MENPFDRFEERRREREAKRLELNKQMAELNAEGDRDRIAVTQLRKLYPNGFPAQSESGEENYVPPAADAIEPAPPPPATASEMQRRGADMTIKDMVLRILRDAHPNGMTASQIKGKAFLNYKKHINPNTLTVSLVRLKPLVKCEDRTWFYMKPIFAQSLAAKSAINGNGGAEQKKSPEVPGLL